MVPIRRNLHFHVGDTQILLINVCYHYKELKRFYRFFKRDIKTKIKKFVFSSHSMRPNFQNLNNHVALQVSRDNNSEYKVVTLKCKINNGHELLQLFADETLKRKIEREIFCKL